MSVAVVPSSIEGAELLTEDEICKDITSMGVKYGIDAAEQQSLWKLSVIMEKHMLLLVGKQPRNGQDGWVEYNFTIRI